MTDCSCDALDHRDHQRDVDGEHDANGHRDVDLDDHAHLQPLHHGDDHGDVHTLHHGQHVGNQHGVVVGNNNGYVDTDYYAGKRPIAALLPQAPTVIKGVQ